MNSIAIPHSVYDRKIDSARQYWRNAISTDCGAALQEVSRNPQALLKNVLAGGSKIGGRRSTHDYESETFSFKKQIIEAGGRAPRTRRRSAPGMA